MALRRTPSCSASARVAGSRMPGPSKPSTIAASSALCTCCGWPRIDRSSRIGMARTSSRRRFDVVAMFGIKVELAATTLAWQGTITNRRMSMSEQAVASYPIDETNRVKRRHDRGHYDHATVHALLDSAALCHVAYAIDGLPYCTPTLYWREGQTLYWLGFCVCRMLRNQSDGEPACLTVTHLDSLVQARCGFNHSADYRSVMAFGHARLIEDQTEKERALVMMVARFFPGRTATLRPSTTQEIKATAVVMLVFVFVFVKIRSMGLAVVVVVFAFS